MRKRWKRSFVTALSMALAVGNCVPAMAAPTGWRQSAAGWQYVNADGSVQKGWFQDTKGDWYFLDYNTGIMRTGWIQPADGKWYFTDYHTGVMKTGWIKPMDGKWYYLNPNSDGTKGAMQTGWVQTPDKKHYYMDASGAMQTGTITIGNQTWTLDANGAWDGKAATTVTYVSSSSSSSRRPSSNKPETPPSDDDNNDPTPLELLKVTPSSEVEGMFDVTIQTGSETPITAEMINDAAKVADAAEKIQNLTIADTVGDGNVTLEGLTVNGETIVNGGGHHSVWFNSCRLRKNVKTGKISVPLRILFVGTTKVEGKVTITGGNVTVGIENENNVQEVEAAEGAETVTLTSVDENKKSDVLLPKLTISVVGITVKVEIPVTTVAVEKENVTIDTTETAKIEEVKPAENVSNVTIEGAKKEDVTIEGFVEVTLNAEGGWTVTNIDNATGEASDSKVDKKTVNVKEQTTLENVIKANEPALTDKVVTGWYKSNSFEEEWTLDTTVVNDGTTWELWAKLENKPGTDNPGTDDPGTDDPGTDDPGTDDPGTDDPGTDDPGTDDPGTDDPGTDDPSTEQVTIKSATATVSGGSVTAATVDSESKKITVNITTSGSAVDVKSLSVETDNGTTDVDVSGWETMAVGNHSETIEIDKISVTVEIIITKDETSN